MLVTVASFIYIASFIMSNDVFGHVLTYPPQTLVYLLLFLILISISNCLIALSWKKILFFLGSEISFTDSFIIFSQANLGKYLPGNVFQFIGRQALSMKKGYTPRIIVKSLVIETSLLTVASCLFLISYGALIYIGLNIHQTLFLLIAFLLALFAVGQIYNLQSLVYATFLYFTYHLFGGLLFLLLLVYVFNQPVDSLLDSLILISAYVSSWILGMLTPGSPAGIGVRESMLVILIGKGLEDQSAFGAIILIYRLLQIFGDLLFYIFCRIFHYFIYTLQEYTYAKKFL
jgi:glycosyltransferase 2 family protein